MVNGITSSNFSYNKECYEVIEFDQRSEVVNEIDWKKTEIKAKNYIVTI